MGGIKNINIDDKPREGRIIYVAMDDWGCAEVFDTVEEAENFKRAIGLL